MRVTMLNKYYPPHLGGIENHVRYLAEALVSYDHAQVRAIVCNEGPETVREVTAGVDVLRLGRAFAYASTPVAYDMTGAIRLEATRPDPADLLHLHFPYPWGEVSWLRASAGLPTVLTYHSDIVRQKAALAVYSPLLRRFLGKVDLIISGSPNLVEHSEFLQPFADKCRVVPFGYDLTRYDATPETLARAAKLREGHTRPIVLFVGRLVYYKGVDVLARAMADVDADLVVIGAGPLEGKMREIAVAGGIADSVTFLPPVPDEELVAWYHAADVLCLPSVERSEAFGAVQVEAHACGTPVVSTDLPTGVPFVNEDGVTGLIVPPGDAGALAGALRRLIDDPDLRARLGAQARDRARTMFSLEAMTSGTMDVYREALESRKKG
jgi:glycosyltransferase involved in cell wall biosynthesis